MTNGGTHGKKGPEKPSDTNQCHDITVYSAIGLAAGACSGNGILLDIKDPVNPKRLDAVNDPNYSYWHSASFSNDGNKVVFTDEWGGGLGARCRPNDPNKWGADAIFQFEGQQAELSRATTSCRRRRATVKTVWRITVRWFRFPAAILKCRPGIRAASPSWTSPTRSIRLKSRYFDRGPIDPKMLVLGGDWSAYWYNGHVYGFRDRPRFGRF